MKNVFEVLAHKEAELERLHKEIEALRIAARLLADDEPAATTTTETPVPVPKPIAAPPPAAAPRPANSGKSGAYSAAWDNAPRQFP